MKLKIFIVIVAVMLAWVAGRSLKGAEHRFNGSSSGGGGVVVGGDGDSGDVSPDESRPSSRQINQSFVLKDGAQVKVTGVNGPVEVEAVDGDTAEVHITSNAGSMSDLNRNQIIVEQTENGFTVRGKNNNHGSGFWSWLSGRGGGSKVRHDVKLKLPRRVVLSASGINGKVEIGEMEGALHLSGINGRVNLAQATSETEVSGINGGVSLTIKQLGAGGIELNGINGAVELRLGRELNAELDVDGLNGRVAVEAPNVQVEEQKRSKLRARIGAGGAEISVNGVNGSMRLVGV